MGFFDLFKKKKIITNKVKVINEELKEAICSLCKNEIFINIDLLEDVKNPKSSKIGGKPFLPNDFIWPTFKSYDDNITRPLSFICQINLDELKEYDKDSLLPKTGMLYFFYECESLTWGFDQKDKGATKVFYYENIDEFIELELPNELESHNIFPEIAIEFESRNSYPTNEDFANYNELEFDCEEYEDILVDLGVDLSEEEKTKLLGYADVIQSEMLTQCECMSRGLYCGDSLSYQNLPFDVKTEINDTAKEWVLLLQVDTISKGDFEMMFGDCGRLFIYIKKSDLEKKDFNNIQFCLQCY